MMRRAVVFFVSLLCLMVLGAENGRTHLDGIAFAERRVLEIEPDPADKSACTYTLDSESAVFNAPGGTGSLTVTTGSTCSWTATTPASWITISSGSSGTGTGQVHFSIPENNGPQRSAYILAAGNIFSVLQYGVGAPVTFTMSNPYPKIGEIVTFSVEPALEVEFWFFGEQDCEGRFPVMNCGALPPDGCDSVEWSFPTAGKKYVTAQFTDGAEVTKFPTVQNIGQCCHHEQPPSASFSISPSSPVVGQRVEFRDTSTPAATTWEWSVYRLDSGGPPSVEVTGSEQNLSHTFSEPGEFEITLAASNCAGSSQASQILTVAEAAVDDFIIGAAVVRIEGANFTNWETDLRFFNPCDESVQVVIEFEPENTNNTGRQLVSREFLLAPNQTRIFADIVEAMPGLSGQQLSGSVLVKSSSGSGCKVLSVSRTFNETPGGSLGLSVPALPVQHNNSDFLDLTGLIHNSDYRANLRLVNYADEDAWVRLELFDRNGGSLGEARNALVRGHSTRQLNEIAPWLGVSQDISPFSVRAEVTGVDVQAFATVVDNLTGDSVLYLSSFSEDNRLWLVGVASLEGVNNSRWRTDLWLYNPTANWLGGGVEFVVGDSPGDSYGFEWPMLGSNRTKQYLDIVGQEFGLAETRGYIVLTGADGGPAPQVAARTYNLDLAGGTCGLNLRAFGERDLLNQGEVGFIIGISSSADPNAGFRTNIGLLNTDREGWTGVRLTLLNVSGAPLGEPVEMMIAPGVLRQFDIAKKFGLSNVTTSASLAIEVTEGGGLAAYATEIDNRSQDSTFIPAAKKYIGAPQAAAFSDD